MIAYLNESIDLALHLLVGGLVIFGLAVIGAAIVWYVALGLKRIFDHVTFRK